MTRATPGTPTSLVVDRWTYPVKVQQRIKKAPGAPRFLVVSRLPTPDAREVLRVFLDGIAKFTPSEHETWVIDNNSPPEMTAWLDARSDVNVIRNLRDPVPPGARMNPWRRRAIWGSYANAVALELGLQCIDPATRELMVFHMDTLPCHELWFPFLRSKLIGNTAAAGVRIDRYRTQAGVLHVLGLLVDYQLFQTYGLNFMPELPDHDVGDKITIRLREEGHSVFACENSHNDPHVSDRLPADSPFRSLAVDRAIDDDGRVIFMHLGRVVQKSLGKHTRGVTPREWIDFAERYVLGP